MMSPLPFSQAELVAMTSGMIVGLGMVFSVGPRTLLLIRLGATSRHRWWVATTGFFSDVVIFLVAVLSIGAALQMAPQAAVALQSLGIGFLVWCGLRALRGGGRQALGTAGPVQISRRRSVLQMLSVTWLNPLVYFEVYLVAGSLSLAFDGSAKCFFAAGYLVASALKFYGWTVVGRQMAQVMMTPTGLGRFNTASAVMLFVVAGTLAWNGLATGYADTAVGETSLTTGPSGGPQSGDGS